ncbi:MAG: vWA domain-containing protein [Myxococcota bacterium]
MLWTAWAVERGDAQRREAVLLVTGEAPELAPRTPVVVNLLLDRSGSMKGAPLAAAVEAASQLVDLCGPEDFAGLLVFDGVAEQLVPVGAMDTVGKRKMHDALQSIAIGRGTALHEAVKLGAGQLSRLLVPGRRPKLLLLTDGEPSVGPEDQRSFDRLGHQLAEDGLSLHALGLARHYVPEILSALTLPSGNGFAHVDAPDGLSVAMGELCAHLFGEASSAVSVRVMPQGFSALACRHAFPTKVENDALVVSLGDIARGAPRRVLFGGPLAGAEWGATVLGSCVERGDSRVQRVELEHVAADSYRGRSVRAAELELELVSQEAAAWLSLARKNVTRAEEQLLAAEGALRELVMLAVELKNVPVRRHLERLGDLRLAVERGEGDFPLLIRRAMSAKAGAHISQVIPLHAARKK